MKLNLILSLLITVLFQSIVYSQRYKVKIINHVSVSSSSEVSKLIKDEIVELNHEQNSIVLTENKRDRINWFRNSAEQKKKESKKENVNAVIEIRERETSTKTLITAEIMIWDHNSPTINPNVMSYKWEEGSKLTSYFIEKSAYYAVKEKEKKDVVIVKFKYAPDNIHSGNIRDAISYLHEYVITTIPKVNSNIRKKYVFKTDKELGSVSYIFITGEVTPTSNRTFNLKLHLSNILNDVIDGEICSFEYEKPEDLDILKSNVTTEILEVCKNKGILEY